MIKRAYQPCAHCGGHIVAQSDDDHGTFEPDDLYLNLLKKVFKGDIKTENGVPAELDMPTTIDTAKTFMKGVFEGFGGDFSAFAYDTPDYNKLAHIERNVYQFNGAKNWQMLRDLTDAIKEGDKILPFSEFKNKALTILEEYQGNWLRTEYNAAIAGSQMASKWVDFEKGVTLSRAEGRPEPLLEYRTMEDDRVRDEHAELNNITRPVNDAFWNTYYPPNGWNCRCTVIRINEGTATVAGKMEYPDIPKMFQVNLAKEGLVFPKGSAYFTDLPKEIKAQVNTLAPDRSAKPKRKRNEPLQSTA